VATIHLFTMVTATVLFALTWLAHLDGYRDGEVGSAAVALGVVALAVLAAGGYIGGSLAFVYGVRVLKHPDASLADALVPGRAGSPRQSRPGDDAPPRPVATPTGGTS
jgi:hypothetical protein